ncbi:MAG: VVA0879 family protein [Georgfuchsia sp.]
MALAIESILNAPVMKVISLGEFQAMLIAQAVPDHTHFALVCPMCGTVQSARDLIDAGAGKTFEDVEKYLGFSCIGRFTGAPSPRKRPDGAPCDWTLGGLFHTHKLEVVTEDGEHHARFIPAEPEVARAHVTARPFNTAELPE